MTNKTYMRNVALELYNVEFLASRARCNLLHDAIGDGDSFDRLAQAQKEMEDCLQRLRVTLERELDKRVAEKTAAA